jgi:hypothetical protein
MPKRGGVEPPSLADSEGKRCGGDTRRYKDAVPTPASLFSEPKCCGRARACPPLEKMPPWRAQGASWDAAAGSWQRRGRSQRPLDSRLSTRPSNLQVMRIILQPSSTPLDTLAAVSPQQALDTAVVKPTTVFKIILQPSSPCSIPVSRHPYLALVLVSLLRLLHFLAPARSLPQTRRACLTRLKVN